MDNREMLVTTALGELGISAPTGDDKYISWYNSTTGEKLPLSVSWCAIFVSWCARKAGVSVEVIPNYASCTYAVKNFRRIGVWKDRTAHSPIRGDLIFFDWNKDPSVSEHTGIVTGVKDGWVQTIEGNSGTPGAVRQKSYALNSTLIIGYAAWEGHSVADPPQSDARNGVKAAQAALNARYRAGLTVDGAWGPASRAAAVRAMQTEINTAYKKNLTVDGSFGPASQAACPTLRKGDKNGLVWVLQVLLTGKKFKLEADSSYGAATEGAVTIFQKRVGLTVDGTAGAAVFAALVG